MVFKVGQCCLLRERIGVTVDFGLDLCCGSHVGNERKTHSGLDGGVVPGIEGNVNNEEGHLPVMLTYRTELSGELWGSHDACEPWDVISHVQDTKGPGRFWPENV
jgi:hypothetical protein